MWLAGGVDGVATAALVGLNSAALMLNLKSSLALAFAAPPGAAAASAAVWLAGVSAAVVAGGAAAAASVVVVGAGSGAASGAGSGAAAAAASGAFVDAGAGAAFFSSFVVSEKENSVVSMACDRERRGERGTTPQRGRQRSGDDSAAQRLDLQA